MRTQTNKQTKPTNPHQPPKKPKNENYQKVKNRIGWMNKR